MTAALGGQGSLGGPPPPGGPRSAHWYPYLCISAWGYLLYGIGSATPLLSADLDLSETLAGLHASALAAGLIATGIGGDRLIGRWGPVAALRAGLLGVAGAASLLALAPVAAASLAGSFLLGAAGGLVLSLVNTTLALAARARIALARANVWAMLAGLAAPLALSLGSATAVGWRVALWLAVPVLVATALMAGSRAAVRGRAQLGGVSPSEERPLGPFWAAWLLVVLVVAVEFSIVYWGSTLLAATTGVSAGAATGLAGAFIGGMFAARGLLALGLGDRLGRGLLLVGCLAVALAGVAAAWLVDEPLVAAGALFVAGLGTGPLYPTAIVAALAAAPEARDRAAARVTLASGTAILLAPLVLAVAADALGIMRAWPLVGLFCLGAIVLIRLGAAGGGAADRGVQLMRAGSLRRDLP